MSIDDNEAHYLKVLLDEIFGRSNFLGNVVWQKRTARDNRKAFSINHDHILVYSTNARKFTDNRNLLPLSSSALGRYKNPDNDPRGEWQSVAMTAQAGHATPSQFYEVVTPTGHKYLAPKGLCWVYTKDKFEAEVEKNNIYFPRKGDGVPRIKRFIRNDGSEGLVPESIWLQSEVGTNDDAKRHLLDLLKQVESVFQTPKPEGLLERIISIATNPFDLVLDSFLGSGTTASVAHKLGRRWIGIELGEHCHTQCIPRLQKVIDGTDQGGISKAVGWKGGGGFRYFRLAPSLLEKDKWGNWVINKEYNKEMLAEAVCKLKGYTYAPSDAVFWQQGYSTESDYIYVTTQNLTNDQLQQISDEVGNEKSLLILCTAFKVDAGLFTNLTIEKIPKSVLNKCEWGHDDYSLNVQNLPMAKQEERQTTLFDAGVEI